MLKKNKKMYITCSLSLQKELANGKIKTYEIKLSEGIRFMKNSLSNVVDNIPEELHKRKCKDCKEYVNVKDGLLVFNCSDCNKNYKKVYEDLAKILENTYRFCDGDVNQFCLMLQKGSYLYEYMDDWVKFNETSWKVRKSYTLT